MAQTQVQQNIGATMPDGTKYVGISPDTGKPMYLAVPYPAFARFMEGRPKLSHFLDEHPKLHRFALRAVRSIPLLKEHIPPFPLVGCSFKEALQLAAGLDAHGYSDWSLPKTGELNKLFNSRAAIGGLNEDGSKPAGWYWSSSQNLDGYAWDQRFSDGLKMLQPSDKPVASAHFIRTP